AHGARWQVAGEAGDSEGRARSWGAAGVPPDRAWRGRFEVTRYHRGRWPGLQNGCLDYLQCTGPLRRRRLLARWQPGQGRAPRALYAEVTAGWTIRSASVLLGSF